MIDVGRRNAAFVLLLLRLAFDSSPEHRTLSLPVGFAFLLFDCALHLYYHILVILLHVFLFSTSTFPPHISLSLSRITLFFPPFPLSAPVLAHHAPARWPTDASSPFALRPPSRPSPCGTTPNRSIGSKSTLYAYLIMGCRLSLPRAPLSPVPVPTPFALRSSPLFTFSRASSVSSSLCACILSQSSAISRPHPPTIRASL